MNKVNYKQGICPVCGNENLEYGSMVYIQLLL